MKLTLDLILLALAAICFGLATFNVSTRINLLALGLLLWVVTFLTP